MLVIAGPPVEPEMGWRSNAAAPLCVPKRNATLGAPMRLLTERTGGYPMRSGCLWLIGVPIPIIILLWLITGHA
jgi:hypothetical protein